jgi:hypothetical protein
MAKYNLPATVENGRDLGDACEVTCEIEVKKLDENVEAILVKVQYAEGAPDEERGFFLIGSDTGFAGLALGFSTKNTDDEPVIATMRLPYPVAVEVLEKGLELLKAAQPKAEAA